MPIRMQAALRELSVALVRTVYPVTVGVRLVGVSVSKLVRDEAMPQLELSLLRDG
jgi:DNA polymerase-4